MWFNLCIISVIINGLSAIVMKKYANNNNTKSITLLGLLYYHIIGIVISLVMYPKCVDNFNLFNIIKIMPLILSQSLGYLCAILSIKYLYVSTSAAIHKLKTIIPLLLGIVVLHEPIKISQIIICIFLIILTVLINKVDKKEEENKDINKNINKKGIIYAYGFVLLNGTSSFLNKIYVNLYDSPFTISLYFGIAIISFIIIYCFITKKWKDIDIRCLNQKRYFILHSFMDSISTIIDRLSLINGPVSIVYSIASSSVLISTIASEIFLKEKISYKKWMIILGIFGCVLLLAILK